MGRNPKQAIKNVIMLYNYKDAFYTDFKSTSNNGTSSVWEAKALSFFFLNIL